MENLFLHYMFERNKREEEHTEHQPGPVITLSREYGCYGSQIAEMLAEKINTSCHVTDVRKEWYFVSHQVLHDATEKLNADPYDISHIFGAEEKTIIGDLISLFSKDKYYSDSHIKRTISRIVRSYAEQGHAIIVGRAGCVIARHIEKSIHIRLMAPLTWRVDRIRDRFNISKTEADKMVKDSDKRRDSFMEFYRGNKPDSELFDIILNRSTMSSEEIVDQIFHYAQQRKLL
jgi:cytidylate kinase